MSRAAKIALLVVAGLIIALALRRKDFPGVESSRPAPAPDFSVKGIDGRTVALSAFRGKVVLVDFWATWCEPCRTEIPAFVSLQKRYGPQGLQIIGISLDDDPKPVREFYQRFAMNYPVALGDAELAERFGGILGLPVAFLIDRDGRIRARDAGQTDAAVFEKQIIDLLRPGGPRRPSPART